MFSFFFEKSRKGGQASSSRLGLFLPTFLGWGGDLRCGADILLFLIFYFRSCFCIFGFFFFFNRWASSSSTESTTLGTDLPEVVLLLREYVRREIFHGDKLSSRLRWEMVPFSCKRYTYPCTNLKLFYSTHHFAHTPMTMPTIQCSLKNAHWVSDPKCLPMQLKEFAQA